MSAAGYRTQTASQAQHNMLATPRSNRSISYMQPYGFCPPGQPQSAASHGEAGSSSGTVGGGPSGSVGSSRSVNPFTPNPHGHPSFNPIRLGSKGMGESKTPKQPKPPDKPLMPYMRYSRKVSRLVWDSVKASNPDLKLWEIGKIIGQMWRELSDAEKQEYLDEYEAEKIQYTDAMKAYHNSPAYQSWIAAKGKVDIDTESEEPEKTRRTTKTPASAREPIEPRIVTIQPADEDDDADDGFSVKHVASARFQRNHMLINDIFSDVVVPDVRTVINESRMTVLKRQVHSLTMHQKKLESELLQIEEKHRAKKCKFAENSEKFYEDLTRLCEERPQISEEQFMSMVSKAKEELREKHKQLQQQQQVSTPPVPPAMTEPTALSSVEEPIRPVVAPPATETTQTPQLVVEKKSDEENSNELEQQSSQQLFVLDKATPKSNNQLDAAAEFENDRQDVDASKENLNDSDSDDGGSDDTQPADDDFTSTFNSVADDAIEMMECSEQGDNNTEVMDKPSSSMELETDNTPLLSHPFDVSTSVHNDEEPEASDQGQWQVTAPTTAAVEDENRDVDQSKSSGQEGDGQVELSVVPDLAQSSHQSVDVIPDLPAAEPASVNTATEGQQNNGEQSLQDTSLLSDDITDESTDETRGESACDTSLGE